MLESRVKAKHKVRDTEEFFTLYVINIVNVSN